MDIPDNNIIPRVFFEPSEHQNEHHIKKEPVKDANINIAMPPFTPTPQPSKVVVILPKIELTITHIKMEEVTVEDANDENKYNPPGERICDDRKEEEDKNEKIDEIEDEEGYSKNLLITFRGA